MEGLLREERLIEFTDFHEKLLGKGGNVFCRQSKIT